MAIIISIDTEFGVPATYWNIGSVQEDFKGKGTEVTIYGYASKEARLADNQPLSAGKIQLVGEDYIPGANRQVLYGVLRQKPEFQNAQDDI